MIVGSSKALKLTTDQLAELEGWNIPLPPTDVGRYRLYFFVKTGNLTHGATEAGRIAYAIAENLRWTGKRVRRSRGNGPAGVVQYLMWRSKHSVHGSRYTRRVATQMTTGGSTDPEMAGYALGIIWDGSTKVNQNSSRGIELVPEDSNTNPVTEGNV